MNSYKILLGVILIFMSVAWFCSYANIGVDGYVFVSPDGSQLPLDEDTDAKPWITEHWYSTLPFIGPILMIPEMWEEVSDNGLGFLVGMATFTVPGLPPIFGAVFWFLALAFTVVLVRIGAGLLTGGGD